MLAIDGQREMWRHTRGVVRLQKLFGAVGLPAVANQNADSASCEIRARVSGQAVDNAGQAKRIVMAAQAVPL